MCLPIARGRKGARRTASHAVSEVACAPRNAQTPDKFCRFFGSRGAQCKGYSGSNSNHLMGSHLLHCELLFKAIFSAVCHKFKARFLTISQTGHFLVLTTIAQRITLTDLSKAGNSDSYSATVWAATYRSISLIELLSMRVGVCFILSVSACILNFDLF